MERKWSKQEAISRFSRGTITHRFKFTSFMVDVLSRFSASKNNFENLTRLFSNIAISNVMHVQLRFLNKQLFDVKRIILFLCACKTFRNRFKSNKTKLSFKIDFENKHFELYTAQLLIMRINYYNADCKAWCWMLLHSKNTKTVSTRIEILFFIKKVTYLYS